MAGYDKIFLFGRPVVEGVTEITMELWQGGNGRMWLEPAAGFKGAEVKVTALIPNRPDDPDMLLDAAMAFCPRAFADVREYREMYGKLKPGSKLDFNLDRNVPEEWDTIRALVRPVYEKMAIFSADIKPWKSTNRV